MKKILLLLLLKGLFVQAQPPSNSLIAQMPYVEEPGNEPKLSLLNVAQMFQKIEPLPDFQIPENLPNDFLVTEAGMELIKSTQKAHGYLQNGEADKAVEIFQEVLEKYPEELGIRVALADSLYATGNHPAAVREYSYVLERSPLNFQCLNNLAWLYATTKFPELKDLGKAEALAEKAKIVQPASHHLWSTLSQIHFDKGEYIQAERSISNALVILQQMQPNFEVVVGYLIQRDRCILALQSTSLLE